jgi:hypothetical protein
MNTHFHQASVIGVIRDAMFPVSVSSAMIF